jgi:predicted TIM-barrel fold metal-dependent hydrolase
MEVINRRDWSASVAGAGLLPAAAPAALSQPLAEIVDAHVHVWTDDLQKYPLAPGFRKEDLWYPSFTAQELMRRSHPCGVTRANLVQMTWYGLDHTYIRDLIANDPKHLVGTGVVPAVTDVAGPSPDAAMIALSRQGIYAFRVRGKSTRPPLDDGPQWLAHPGYEKMFRAGAEHNLALSFLMSAADLPELDRMCARFPRTPVIIDHFCLIGSKDRFPEADVAALCRMARHKSVLVKVGGFYALGAAKPPYRDMLPLLRRVVDAFGPERCMWESDCPKQVKDGHTYDAALALVRDQADFLSRTDKEQILVKTAESFFFKR